MSVKVIRTIYCACLHSSSNSLKLADSIRPRTGAKNSRDNFILECNHPDSQMLEIIIKILYGIGCMDTLESHKALSSAFFFFFFDNSFTDCHESGLEVWIIARYTKKSRYPMPEISDEVRHFGLKQTFWANCPTWGFAKIRIIFFNHTISDIAV